MLQTEALEMVQAEHRFPELVRRASAGQQITITENGQAVARLLPLEPKADLMEARRRYEEFLKIRPRIVLGPDLTIRQLIDEGRR